MSPVERLILRVWPHARHSRAAPLLKRSPLFLQRLASVAYQPEIVERILERPKVVRWRLARLARSREPARPLAIGYGFEYYKRRLLRQLYPENQFVFLPFARPRATLAACIAPAPDFVPWVWSYRDEAAGLDSAFWRGRTATRVEDGFIRSTGLGSSGILPFSLCVDRSGLYFDASQPSDLETLAVSYDFEANPSLLNQARVVLKRMVESRLTKYNFRHDVIEPDVARKEPRKRRVLVIGQVEDDQSIVKNPGPVATNEALIEHAIEENPDAEIIYRPHPDIVSGNRNALSNPERLLPAYRLGQPGQSLASALDACDAVYTISSLVGFEALFRGKKVKTFGAPFYAGWSLTEDAMVFPRRHRRLTLLELFALAYIVYPVYFDPATGNRLTIEAVLDILEEQLAT